MLGCTCRQGLWVLRFLYSCAKYSKKRNGHSVALKQRKHICLHSSTLVVYSCVNCNAVLHSTGEKTMHEFRENYKPEPAPEYRNTGKDYLTAVVIGTLLALALTAWWSA